MANSLFRLSPTDSMREGNKQVSQAGELNSVVTELFSTIDSLLETGYTSPGAREMYAKIQSKRPILNGAVKTVNNSGLYLLNSGKETINTDDSIADGVKI